MPLFAPTSFAPAVTSITSYPLTPLPPKKRRKLEIKISLLLRSSKPVPVSLLAALKESRKTARALIFKSRADYFNNMLASVKPNSKVFWKTANSILHISPPSPPRSSSEAMNLVNIFSSF